MNDQERYNRLMEQLQIELGSEIMAACLDEAVTGIKVGGDGKLIVKKHSIAWENTGIVLDANRRVRLLGIISSELGKTFNGESALLSGELPRTGSRLQGWGNPLADTAFVIRRHSSQIFTLDDYVTAGILEPWQADLLRQHILNLSTIVVCGATDSGKTTFLNALIAEMVGTQHLIILEDTTELRCEAENVLRLKSDPPRVTLRDLVTSTLRADGDRLIIGEVRGPEGWDMIQALNMGRRGGLTTVHADNARGALLRFGMMCQQAGLTPQWLQIQEAIDVIVHIKMQANGKRRVTELQEVQHENVSERIPIELKPLGPALVNGVTH